MKLLLYPDEFLKTHCDEVKLFNEQLWNNLDHMKVIMQQHDGMGLAANQVGLLQRMFIMKDSKEKIWEFINPVIYSAIDAQYENEGCLRFPGIVVQVKRVKQVSVKAQDRSGEWFGVGAIDKEAVCIQHEIDHLNGITFLDYLSRQQRREALRSLR